MYDSFVRYQTRLIHVFDRLAQPYGFTTVDASRPPDQVFEALQTEISRTFAPRLVGASSKRPPLPSRSTVL